VSRILFTGGEPEDEGAVEAAMGAELGPAPKAQRHNWGVFNSKRRLENRSAADSPDNDGFGARAALRTGYPKRNIHTTDVGCPSF
jgi:hypothetical protein